MAPDSVSLAQRVARGYRRMRLARQRTCAPDPAAANAALNAAEIRHGCTRLRSTPLTIQLMTTWLCNLRCPFCRREMPDHRAHIESLDADASHLPWEVVERVFAVAPHALSVTLTPLGEPTLYRHWERLLDRAGAIGLTNLEMTTNGTRFPEALCEKIVRAGFREIHLSVDSDDPETFAAMRLGTTLEKVEAGLDRFNAAKRRLGSARPSLHIAATFDRRNIEHLPRLVDFAARHGAVEIIVQKMEIYDPASVADDLTRHAALTRRMVDEAQRRGRERGVRVRLHYALLNQIGEAAAVEGAARSSAAMHAGDDIPRRLTDLCTHPWHFIVVDTNGDVRPCCWAAVRFGNLVETPDFDAVWNGEVARQMRADFLRNRLTPGCLDKHCGVSAAWARVTAAGSASPR